MYCWQNMAYLNQKLRIRAMKSWVCPRLVVHYHTLLVSLRLKVYRTGSWTEQHFSCFYWLSTHTHTPLGPLRHLRSPTLAFPQDMRGSCVSQAKSWRNSPRPPPHFLPVPPASPLLVFWFCTKLGTLRFALKGYRTPLLGHKLWS